MSQVLSRRLAEAEELLKEVNSWSEEEIKDLPKLYRERAREYRGLLQHGED
ncbi:hypothetical protein [Halobellus rubicundus]|uniref:Uncharacterized protein n=1 Tax=Halobellus rubicundus TaxID=2996466 RepID=A0ABD5MAJ5_9EURY